MNLAWGVIRKKVETSVIKPSNLERKTKEYNEKNYLGKVITPWYCEKVFFKYYIYFLYNVG